MDEYTRIFIEDQQVEVKAGFAEWERHPDRLTTLLVSADLFAANTEWPDRRLEALVDYSRLRTYIAEWPQRAHTESLEELCEDLLGFCFADARVVACRVRIKKPHIFPDAAAAGVEIYRRRGLPVNRGGVKS